MTASNQPSESDIGMLFALFCKRCAIGDDWRETYLQIFPDGTIGFCDFDNNRFMWFQNTQRAISKLRAAIEAAAPKPAEVSEPDGKFYLQSSAGGDWDFWCDLNGFVVRKTMKQMADMDVDYYAQKNPGISFRLADNNGLPLSIPLTVSSELDAGELGKLGALDMDAVYGEGE